jgi:acyl carrier protein
MTSDVESQLRAFISDAFPAAGDAGTIDSAASLIEGGVIDSLGVLSLVGFLEETFGIAVADDDMMPENLDSIDALVAFVARKTAGPGS